MGRMDANVTRTAKLFSFENLSGIYCFNINTCHRLATMRIISARYAILLRQ
jgi:hypothetical protein